MIECLICHKMHKRICSHLIYKHGLHVIDYLKLFPNAKTNSDETIEKMRMSKLGYKVTEEHRKNLSLSHLGFVPTDETRKKLSIKSRESINLGKFKKGNVPHNKGKTKDNYSPLMKVSNSTKGRILSPNSVSLEANLKRGISLKKAYAEGRKVSCFKEKGHRFSKGNKPWNKDMGGQYSLPQNSQFMKEFWQDKNNVKIMTENRVKGEQRKFNKDEKKLDKILQKNYPGEWKYNSWEIIIERKIPDFVNINGKKQFIEYLGCYHHHCKICFPDSGKEDNFESRKEIFKKYGFDCLAIWGHELKNEDLVIKKVNDFMNGVKI